MEERRGVRAQQRDEHLRFGAGDQQRRRVTQGLAGHARYYDINNDGSLNNDDLVYQGNADPDLYGGLQNNFRFGRLNVGIYFTYSLGGKIYNYSELYMAGSSMSNQYRYMLEAWHPVRNPQSNLPRAGAVDAHVPSDLMIYDASYIRLKNITVGYTFDLSKRSKFIRDITLNLSAENLHIWKSTTASTPTSRPTAAIRRCGASIWAHTPSRAPSCSASSCVINRNPRTL